MAVVDMKIRSLEWKWEKNRENFESESKFRESWEENDENFERISLSIDDAEKHFNEAPKIPQKIAVAA